MLALFANEVRALQYQNSLVQSLPNNRKFTAPSEFSNTLQSSAPDTPVIGGMSGLPIVDYDGLAIAVICNGGIDYHDEDLAIGGAPVDQLAA